MAGVEMLYSAGTNAPQALVRKNNSPTSSATATPQVVGVPIGGGYLGIAQSATNQIYYFSLDGVNWIQLLSETTGTFMTPTGWGIGGLSVTTGIDIYASMTYFRQTANSTCT